MKTLTQCPKCGGPETDSDPACLLCHGTGVCSADLKFELLANVNRVAAEDYAKKLDELTAELAHYKEKWELWMGHFNAYNAVFKKYQIEGDFTLEDVCDRLSSANAGLREENRRLKRVIKAAQAWWLNPDNHNTKQLLETVDTYNKGGDADDRPGAGPAVQVSAPAVAEAEVNRLKCDHCDRPATLACACPRCLRELHAGNTRERFYTCDAHVSEVSQKHDRIRERIAVWSELPTTLRDVCTRLTLANAELQEELQLAKRVVMVAQHWEREMPNFAAELAHRRLIDVVRAYNERTEGGDADARVRPSCAGTCTCAEIQRADPRRHFKECPLRAVFPEVPDHFPSDITSPLDEIRDSILGGKNDRVASAAERAASKVGTGIGKEALLQFAAELRRGQ